MKAITLHQPWASLIALGEKRFETRSWSTKYRGPLLIHAGKGKAEWNDPVWRAMDEVDLMRNGITTFGPMLPGVALATCTLVDCVPMVGEDYIGEAPYLRVTGKPMLLRLEDFPSNSIPMERQRPWGDFQPGRWAWLLDDIEPCEPVPMRGKQGLWTTDLVPPLSGRTP